MSLQKRPAGLIKSASTNTVPVWGEVCRTAARARSALRYLGRDAQRPEDRQRGWGRDQDDGKSSGDEEGESSALHRPRRRQCLEPVTNCPHDQPGHPDHDRAHDDICDVVGATLARVVHLTVYPRYHREEREICDRRETSRVPPG